MIWKIRLSCHALCCRTRYRFLSQTLAQKTYIQYMDIYINKSNLWLGVSDFSHWQCLCMCVCGCLSFQGQHTMKIGVWWPRSRNHSNISFVKFKLTHFHNIYEIHNLLRIHIICNYWCINIDILMTRNYKPKKYPNFLKILIDARNKTIFDSWLCTLFGLITYNH